MSSETARHLYHAHASVLWLGTRSHKRQHQKSRSNDWCRSFSISNVGDDCLHCHWQTLLEIRICGRLYVVLEQLALSVSPWIRKCFGKRNYGYDSRRWQVTIINEVTLVVDSVAKLRRACLCQADDFTSMWLAVQHQHSLWSNVMREKSCETWDSGDGYRDRAILYWWFDCTQCTVLYSTMAKRTLCTCPSSARKFPPLTLTRNTYSASLTVTTGKIYR